jgi:hypothetical protein
VKYKKSDEFPEFIINAISDVVSQYSMELDVKDQDTILRFSSFSNDLVSRIEDYMIQAHEVKVSTDIEYLYSIAEKRKSLWMENKSLYLQMEHLLEIEIPEYVIDAIIESVLFISKGNNFKHEFESQDFYCRFGENLSLDIQNYMAFNKKQS